MSKKNIFILAAWYVAGWIISSFYNKKKPGELKKELDASRTEWEWDFKVILNNFISTHQNLLEDLKVQVMSDKNKELFNSKKDDLLKIVDTYKDQWVELVDELKVKWKEFLSEASDNLEKMYAEKKDEIDALKDSAPEKITELKNKAVNKAVSKAKDIKEKITNI